MRACPAACHGICSHWAAAATTAAKEGATCILPCHARQQQTSHSFAAADAMMALTRMRALCLALACRAVPCLPACLQKHMLSADWMASWMDCTTAALPGLGRPASYASLLFALARGQYEISEAFLTAVMDRTLQPPNPRRVLCCEQTHGRDPFRRMVPTCGR